MKSRAKIIKVKIEKSQTGLFRATSPDMSAVHAAASTVEKVQEMVKSMIADLFEEDGKCVEIFEVEDHAGVSISPWVIVPRDSKPAPC